ncbi:MAG: hypothetical protein ACYC0F_14655 [Rhodanobacter sp.]
MHIGRQGICLWAVVVFSFSSLCHAQSKVTPEDEYKKLIRVSEDIQPLGENPFGEQVSLYNGSLSFDQTDISLPGNGPLLQVSRSFRTMETHPDNPVGGLSGSSIDGAFSDWDIDLPRITTLVGYHAINNGWIVPGSSPYARCSHFGMPPTIAGWQGNAPWEPHSWWAGYQLIVPGAGSQDLLSRATPENPLAPSAGTAAYPIVTTRNWMVGCGVSTDDETNGGEGFLVLAPDGTKYTLNHLVYRWASTIDRAAGTGPAELQSLTMHPQVAPTDYLQRLKAEMLVTKVEDRFGNTLTYSYDPNNPGSLTAITASDGRHLTLAHEDGSQRITKATLTDAASGTSRVWQYVYDTASNGFHRLENVILPDNTQWTFNLGILFANMTPDVQGSCDEAAQFYPKSWIGTIVHPSGLTGSFTIAPLIRGRSYVPRECVTPAPGSSYASLPRVYYLPAITSKTFTGAGLPSTGKTWNYSYSPANESWTDDACAASQSCAGTVWTDVLDPDGHDVRYTFSNRFDYSESQLLTTEYHSGNASSSVLRSESNSYAVLPVTGTWPWPWPSRYGYNLQSRTNAAQVEGVSPQLQRTIAQGGDSYTWQAEAFDAYGQVTKTKRFNSIAGQSAFEEQTSYLNDLSHWVLGLPLQVTNVTTGETESLNTYDLTDVTLQSRARFGQTLMSYTFNSAGQLASFTDGNSNTTTLGSYKRGIPQAIGYPDGTGETLVVDDFGQIGKITDQAGHATSYSYDPVGRITGISYPTGDEVAWLPKTFAYDFVTSAERGVPANHWRRTTTTGSAKAVTYFDAMLRPVLSDSAIGSAVQASTLTTYDAKGQKVFSAYPSATALIFPPDPPHPTDPTVKGSTTSYDALGRVTQVAQDSELGTLTSSTAYLSGARQQVTDPKGNVTTTSYQVFDSPSYDAVTKVQAPAGITQTIARDLYGNPLSITQSGLYGATETDSVTKTLTYDSYHRLCRTTEPESGSTVMAYDGANNLAWSAEGLAITGTGCGQDQVAAAAKTSRTYDAMNRVLTLQPPSGTQSTTYTYDALGNLASATSGISLWTASHNKRGQLTGETLQLTGQGAWTIGYAHDAYGSLSMIHYPDGEAVDYTPDALGRATKAGSYASNIAYYPNGQLAQFDYGSGAAYATDPNARQLVSNFSYGTGSVTQLSEKIIYDANGNITKSDDWTEDQGNGPRTKTFGYDALNRLTSAQANGMWGTESYTYDPLNNIRTRVTGGQTFTYNYDATKRLSNITNGSATVSSYVYDNLGNVINNNGANLTFDQKNQLTRIQGYDDYAYDAAGRRVMKTPAGGGAPTYYFYNHAGQLMYQVDAATLKSTHYIYLGSHMIARNVLSGAPSLSTPALSSTGSYTVSWSGVGGTSIYTVQEQVSGGSWTTIQTSGATSKAISGKADGSYGYRVQACNSFTCAPWSGTATTVVLHPPATPASITIPATSSGSVAVSWAASATATSYTLQHANYGITGWSTIYSGSATSYTQHETTSGAWIYQVQACNAGGCSAFKVSSGGVTVTIPPASAPTLTVPATSSTGSYTVSWGAVAAATSYTLQEQVNGGSWATIQASSATSKALSGKGDGTYGYRVQACNAGGCAAWSSTHSTKVTHPPTAAPSLSVPASNTSGSYTVSWGAVSLATSYTLQEQVNGGGWTTIQGTGATSKALSGKYSDTYGYRVQGCNAGGCGPWSTVHSVVVLRIPGTPGWPSLSVKAGAIVTATWGAVADAATYTVEDVPSGGSAATFYSGPNTTASRSLYFNGQVTFHVKACNASGCSGWSANSYITIEGDPGLMAVPPAESSSAQEVSGE